MKMDMQSMLQQAQKMQQEIERIKNEASQKIVTASSGGGMVTIKMSGANEVKEITISKEIVNPDDIEMLEDLIVAAVNNAIVKASDMMNEDMKQITGGLPNIPGLDLGL